ncbi:histidine kinase OS=Streptomyces fumanus OX=67302 GN=GCM10018772_10850 PE=4 SV=1 [Streptomyces fumanus]
MRLHPSAADGLIAAALTTVAALLGTEAVAQGWPAPDPVAWALVALIDLPLALRTRAPLTVCLVVHASWVVYVSLGYWPVVGSFGPMLALYTVASLRPTPAAAASAALLAGVWIYAGVVSDADAMASVVGQAVGFPLVLWRFGYVARQAASTWSMRCSFRFRPSGSGRCWPTPPGWPARCPGSSRTRVPSPSPDG